ncbi:hypothetical protein QYM18_03010 [Ectopseudomonas chengduensis]|nr:hypothetical protein [Pseudomonas chengduensis]WKC38069.1 hypothetical protein QYM18_03010 [Pseudomonas chengduensis]
MANKPSPSRQHKHLAVLIDADNALVATANNLIEFNLAVDKLRIFNITYA